MILEDKNYPTVDKKFIEQSKEILNAADPIAPLVWMDNIGEYAFNNKDKITEEQFKDLIRLAQDMEIITDEQWVEKKGRK